MRFGNTTPGPAWRTLLGDRIYLFDVGPALPVPLVVGSLIARLDGFGGGSGQQRLRPVVMERDDPSTLSLGDEVVVQEAQAESWVHMTFDLPPSLRAVEVRLGFATGPASGVARVAGDVLADAGVFHASPYDAPPSVAGGTLINTLATLCLLGVEPWTPPLDLTDDQLAGLPLRVARRSFDTAPTTAPEAASCGWHYSADDPPPAATAVVPTGGRLAALVGERLRVSVQWPTPASVVVYVADEQEFDDDLAAEDLSLSRAAFRELAPLTTDLLPVTYEVLS